MTIVGYNTQTSQVTSGNITRTDAGISGMLTKFLLLPNHNIFRSETQTVFLKCFIELTESDKEAVPWINSNLSPEKEVQYTNSKMKRKYQKRKRRSYITDRKSFCRKFFHCYFTKFL